MYSENKGYSVLLYSNNHTVGSSPPQNFIVMVLNSTAVKLSWEYPDSPNGKIQGYSILYAEFPFIEEVLINITLDTINDASGQAVEVAELVPYTQYSFHRQVVEVAELAPYTRYSFRVRAFSFGDQNERPNFGIATDEIIVRTAEDGKIIMI